MQIPRQELAEYGRKIAQRGLTAGAGGNLSVRDARMLWIKPSGMAMEELTGRDMSGLDLATGRLIEGQRPSSEWPLHVAVYKARPDILAVFHTHSPWASGVVTSTADVCPMFAEVVNDLGRIAVVPYITPGGQDLARAVADAARDHDTIFMVNHGVVALGRTMKQAYYRCCVAEDAARSLVAARLVGQPCFLTEAQIAELRGLEVAAYRTAVAEGRA